MNFEALEILADIVRVGSLSAVARERRLTPSTISRLIAGLESELGTRLLQRTTRRVTPTEAALTLLEHAQPHPSRWVSCATFSCSSRACTVSC